MNVIGRFLGVASILLVALALRRLVREVRRPQPVRVTSALIGLVMAPLTLVVNLVLLRQAGPGAPGAALLAVGLGFGAAWGQVARLERRGTQVVARRSVLHFTFWGTSYALTQGLATFTTARWVAGGLIAMCFSAGTTIGTELNLLTRRRRVATTSPRRAGAGAAPLPNGP